MSRAKNQHYVPQFYLKNFCHDGRTLFTFDKAEGKSFRTGVDNVASEKRFYDLPPNPSGTSDFQAVEKAFSVIEDGTARVLTDLIAEIEADRSFDLQQPERKTAIAFFLALQHCRTREFRDTLGRISQAVSEAVAKKHAFAAEHLARKGEKVVVQPLDLGFPKEIDPLHHADYIFNGEYLQRCVPILTGHIWVVGENQSSQPLFTSDVPIVCLRHVHHPALGGAGLGSLGVEVVFPLSPKHLLALYERCYFARWEPLEGRIFKLELPQVLLYNSFQAAKSYRQIYCSEDKFDQVRELIERFPQLSQIDRPRFTVTG
jgi:hypothetical protein